MKTQSDIALTGALQALRLGTANPFHSDAEDNARMLELSRERGAERRMRRAAERIDLPVDVVEVLQEAHARCAAQLARLEAAADDLESRHVVRQSMRRELSARGHAVR